MDSFDLQVMLKDGSLIIYEVRSNTNDDYEILSKGIHLISFKANLDGTWTAYDNSGNIDAALQERIAKQLNGFRM